MATVAFFNQTLFIDSIIAEGTGIAPVFSVDSYELSFGDLFVDSIHVDSIVVSNSGVGFLNITDVVSTDSNFSVTPTSASIAGASSQMFFVTFIPKSEGAKSGMIIFTSNGLRGHDTITVSGNGKIIQGVKDRKRIPTVFSLYTNYPNPFNPTTTIAFDVPKQTTVTLEVYNTLGQRVAALISRQSYSPGSYEVSFGASGLASGMYIYRMVTPEFHAIKKMLLMK
jgi:hypothetical protein